MTDPRSFRYLLLTFLSLVFLTAAAEDTVSRPVVSSYRLEIGRGEARSTYLSPLRYSGPLFALSAVWQKAFNRNPENTVMTFAAFAGYRNMLNPPHSARMLGFDAGFNWGMAYRKRLPHSFQLTAGGLLDINGGALYLTRNGNNPVTVLASAGIDLDFSISRRFELGRLPVIVADRVCLPVIGAFFCPGYGETFYEIYVGNRKGLAHCGWWGNNFGVGNYLSLKLDFGRTAMEIGYRYDYRSTYANHLTTRVSGNTFVIGVIPGGLGLKKKSLINSPLY